MTDDDSQTMSTSNTNNGENRAVPVNTIAASVLDEPAEYTGGERMYAVLFDEDYEGLSVDANGDVAVLFDRKQAQAVRETLDEIVATLGGEVMSEPSAESVDTE